jgi:DNA-directed RNA polymerase subunit F
MIIQKKPITIPEVLELVGDSEKANKIRKFAKEFTKMDSKKAKTLKINLEKLNIIKLDQEHIVSLINFLPRDAQDIMKVLEGISLDQEEINKILEVLKE